ncbi:MAG: hypothetical protein D4R79_00675 [Comamonadaceae bacterium]|nr:MAG: hypothetical protein D4R79_00675 [Comamonadaceae bacterium]
MSWLAKLKNQQAPSTCPTKPAKPGSVGFAGNQDRALQKIQAQRSAANEAGLEADRWAWPHSSAMNGAEIDVFTARLARFTDLGVSLSSAEVRSDRLVQRDRECDRRHLCLECSHLKATISWRCINWQQAGVAMAARHNQLPNDLVFLLQDCPGFKDWLHPRRFVASDEP